MSMSRSQNHSRPVTSSGVEVKKRVFVFGSSTPRELSHMSAVTRRQRLIDAKKEKAEAGADINGEPRKDILYYMRQVGWEMGTQLKHDSSLVLKARSVPPGSRGQLDRPGSNWAFGSSTPRELSHLVKVKPEQRVYDVKLRCGGAERSVTTSAISDKYSGKFPSL
jgi:hypothetical protein